MSMEYHSSISVSYWKSCGVFVCVWGCCIEKKWRKAINLWLHWRMFCLYVRDIFHWTSASVHTEWYGCLNLGLSIQCSIIHRYQCKQCSCTNLGLSGHGLDENRISVWKSFLSSQPQQQYSTTSPFSFTNDHTAFFASVSLTWLLLKSS